MAEDKGLFSDALFGSREAPVEPETVGALDYFTDVPVGIANRCFNGVYGVRRPEQGQCWVRSLGSRRRLVA